MKYLMMVIFVMAVGGNTANADNEKGGTLMVAEMAYGPGNCLVGIVVPPEKYWLKWRGNCHDGMAQGNGTLALLSMATGAKVFFTGTYDKGHVIGPQVGRFVTEDGSVENVCAVVSDGKPNTCWGTKVGAYRGNLMKTQ